MARAPGRTLPLTIQLSDPPAGVAFAVQVGKADLAAPTRQLSDGLEFDVAVTVTDRVGETAPRFTGPTAQGPANGRFIYVNVGTYAGQDGSPRGRRAKIMLTGIDWPLVDAALATPGSRLRARYAGKDCKGEPACAIVPLLDGGWRLVSDRAA